MNELSRVRNGEELPVDYAAIEKSLSELWRSEREGDQAVTRAALWNVVAHATNPRDHSHASQVLSEASVSVPQRAIVIRAEIDAPSDIASWISANCHRLGGEKQVCSEEVAIVAGGSRVRHIPPLVNALLIPDMPVAVWWLGDLPSEEHAYVETLLAPADRLIVDSTHFDSIADLIWLREIAERTVTAPADLNWIRLEDWRVATASLFDDEAMRARLRTIRKLHITAIGRSDLFGHSIEQLYYAAWMNAQTGGDRAGDIEYRFDLDPRGEHEGALTSVRIEFEDGLEASIQRDPARGVVLANADASTQPIDCVTRVLGRTSAELIVRQLKRPETDQVFAKALPFAIQIASRLS